MHQDRKEFGEKLSSRVLELFQRVDRAENALNAKTDSQVFEEGVAQLTEDLRRGLSELETTTTTTTKTSVCYSISFSLFVFFCFYFTCV